MPRHNRVGEMRRSWEARIRANLADPRGRIGSLVLALFIGLAVSFPARAQQAHPSGVLPITSTRVLPVAGSRDRGLVTPDTHLEAVAFPPARSLSLQPDKTSEPLNAPSGNAVAKTTLIVLGIAILAIGLNLLFWSLDRHS